MDDWGERLGLGQGSRPTRLGSGSGSPRASTLYMGVMASLAASATTASTKVSMPGLRPGREVPSKAMSNGLRHLGRTAKCLRLPSPSHEATVDSPLPTYM